MSNRCYNALTKMVLFREISRHLTLRITSFIVGHYLIRNYAERVYCSPKPSTFYVRVSWPIFVLFLIPCLMPHCVKSVQVRRFFWSVFSCIWTEYGDLLHKSPYPVRIQENADQKNSVFCHFSRSAK